MEQEAEIIAAELSLAKIKLSKATPEEVRTILRILSGEKAIQESKPRAEKSRRVTIEALGGSFLKESCKVGAALIAEHRERLRGMKARLPSNDDDADKVILRSFRKSTMSYRQFPDGSWGFRKQPALELVG
jgi:heme oxygenase